MEESTYARRISQRENADYKAQYISLDLALPKISNGWEESPKFRRGMQISLESHEEFEFTMSNAAMKDDLYEPTMEVSPADELFFRGQLLPLQHDPRLHLVHTLSGIKSERIEESVHFKSSIDEEMAMKLAYEEAFPFARTDDDGFFMDSSYQEGLSMKCANEEGFDVLEGSNTLKPHRPDRGTDGLKNDSHSSSFRSQQSSYWGSGEKDSRDSSSSSRCSNGSSQDACYHGTERKASHPSRAMANVYANVNAVPHVKAAATSDDSAQHGKPPLPASKSKKWSWKAIFTGLRKASKIWVDDRGDEHNQSTWQRESKTKKVVFGFTTTGQTSKRGMRMEKNEHEGKISHNYMCSVEAKKGRQQASSSRGKSLANEECGGHISSKYYVGNGKWRGYNYYEGSNGGRPGKEKARMGIIAWNARESWQRWVKRPLYGKAPNTHKHTSLHEDMHSFRTKAKSLSSTPLTKSPVRRSDNVVSHDAEYGALCCSAKYTNVGFAASCPASMRSSPHHSGVLAVVNTGPPASSLHDLHTAIQGAIAHCKQSQTANPL